MGRRSYSAASDRLDRWHQGQPTTTGRVRCPSCQGRGVISDLATCERDRMRRIAGNRPIVQGSVCTECDGLRYVIPTPKSQPTTTAKEIPMSWEETEKACAGSGGEFIKLAAKIPIIPEIEEYPLESANEALLELKERKIRGAKVLKIA